MYKYFGIKPDFLDKENIISKMNLLLNLERTDPYHTTSTLQDRIKFSLECLPAEKRKYALALFANTIYFPSSFSNAVLEHLLNHLQFEFGISGQELGDKCLIVEQDPTGIINLFLRTNHIEGRLDKEKFQRTQQLKSFVITAIINSKYPEFSKKPDDTCTDPLERLRIENVEPFLDRDYWVVLVDNSLSGTSLISDARLLLECAKQFEKTPKKIILMIRTLTSQALNAIEKEFESQLASEQLEYHYGLLLDERFVIRRTGTDNGCKLFNDRDTYEGVLELCEWFAMQPFYASDGRLEDHKLKSKDNSHVKGFDEKGNMEFGFKGCGLTFVSSENCPSDSLPLLWYRSPGNYMPPFPRVLSRIGDYDHKNGTHSIKEVF